VTATLTGGLSGFALTHSDVGGYTSIDHNSFYVRDVFGYGGAPLIRDRELLLRWIESNTFSDCLLRTHEGLLPQDNHQVWSDELTLRHFKRFTAIFIAFKSYRRGLMAEATSRGWPIARHPMLHYPDDPVLKADRSQADGGEGRIRQFMLGPDWMIMPVVTPGAQTVRGYLPRGSWVPLWTRDGASGASAETGLAGSAAAPNEAAAEAEHVVPGPVQGPGWFVLPSPLGEPAVYHRLEASSAADIRAALAKLDVLGPFA